MEIKMTAINTNTASMNAQYYLAKTNKEMESSMAKLSSGLKVNSAADDAAGLAIANRMTSQIKGLNMAIKNASDTVALAQTAEGAMDEVSNMLQRIRELAVQASNGTINDSDRASLDSEVQALKTEIDRVSQYTQFNNQNLLDGTFSKQFQIGDKSGQTVGLDITSVSTASLGMGLASTGGEVIISGRVSYAAMAEGDVKINGQDIGAIAASPDMEDVLSAINDNVDNVVATAFNTVVAKTIGDGETADDDFEIEVAELGQASATVFYISASNSMVELVANINNETGGVVAATINADGKLVLSNQTGATIKVTDGSTSDAAGFNGGSGFGGTTQQTFNGFIKLASSDGSTVQIERGNLALTAPGAEADLQTLGFRETTRLTDDDAYTITGATLTDNTTAWGKTDLTINGVEIYDEDIATTSIQGRLDAINNFSAQTGVVASAYFEKVLNMTDSHAGSSGTAFKPADLVRINGVSASFGASLGALIANINTDTTSHGIKAVQKGNNMILQGSNVAGITIEGLETAGGGTMTNTDIETILEAGDGMARLRLDSLNNRPISIALGDTATVAEHGFLETNVGAADYMVNSPTIAASGAQSSISGLSVATMEGAAASLATLDAAIDQVSSIRSDLGALQNRLDHTMNNLSTVRNNTENAKGRIMDTDFASETANLTKQQILSQASTSMLAQANQSKQGILALLQG
jgi:flagellin